MDSFFNILSWVLTIGSLIGGQLVINKNKKGY